EQYPIVPFHGLQDNPGPTLRAAVFDRIGQEVQDYAVQIGGHAVDFQVGRDLVDDFDLAFFQEGGKVVGHLGDVRIQIDGFPVQVYVDIDVHHLVEVVQGLQQAVGGLGEHGQDMLAFLGILFGAQKLEQHGEVCRMGTQVMRYDMGKVHQFFVLDRGHVDQVPELVLFPFHGSDVHPDPNDSTYGSLQIEKGDFRGQVIDGLAVPAGHGGLHPRKGLEGLDHLEVLFPTLYGGLCPTEFQIVLADEFPGGFSQMVALGLVHQDHPGIQVLDKDIQGQTVNDRGEQLSVLFDLGIGHHLLVDVLEG